MNSNTNSNWWLLACFSLIGFAGLTAQNEALNWHFGDSVVVSFASGFPERLTNTSMITPEGSASISDAAGNLLFYTNGGGRFPDSSLGQNPGMIWNRNHQVMYDMMGSEGGGFSSGQSSVIFPDPVNPNNYYLFTMEELEYEIGGNPPDQPLGRGLSYFYIDMSLNDGLGGVSLADQRVFVPSYEALAATNQADDQGYWLVINGENTDELVVVGVDENGVGEPQTQTTPIELEGSIKISPDGSWLAVGNSLFRFDAENGQVGDLVVTLPEHSRSSHSFTPDSRFYYSSISNLVLGRRIVRYDLTAGDLLGSQIFVGILGVTSVNRQMQIGPNGNLYFIETGDLFSAVGLSEIVCPSSISPTYNSFVLDFSDTDEFFIGLPNYVDALFRELGTVDTSVLAPIERTVCRGEAISARQTSTSYQWSTGDTTFSIIPEQSGTYVVTITNDCGVTLDSQLVTVDTVPPATIEPITFEDSCPGSVIGLFVDSAPLPDSVVWSVPSDGDTLSIVANAGEMVTATAFYACGSRALSFTLPDLAPEISAEIISEVPDGLCPGDPVTLRVEGNNLLSVSWSTGEEGFVLEIPEVDSTLTYTANITAACDSTFELRANPFDFSGCLVDCLVEFPDIISPNGDGRNDLFRVFTNCDLEDFQLTIWNRWGQEVYSSSDPAVSGGWDGTKEGEPQPMDAYLFLANYRLPGREETEQFDGQFSLIR